MKRIIVIFAILAFTSCGGGGGGGPKVIKECRDMCDLGCTKVAVCHGASSQFADDCTGGCINKFAEDGDGTVKSCNDGTVLIASATCLQLDTFLGLRSAERMASPADSSIGDGVAEYGLN